MPDLQLTFLGGVLLGLTSTLHCSGMCGGISCAALLSLGGSTLNERCRHTLLLQMGRIFSYCVLGAVGSGLGSLLLSPHKTFSFQSVQWIAAVVLMWSGLALAGMLPRLILLDALMERASFFFERLTLPLRGTSAAPLSLGCIWGLNPCPMVYAALFTASLTASPITGVLVMAGFGLGTMPGVVLSGFGLSTLKNMSSNRISQGVAGVLMALFGFVSLYLPTAKIFAFCITP